MMPVITLTTDLGLKDFYLATVRGAMLSQCPEAHVIDISHQVAPFNIAQAAFILKDSYSHFPKKTVHIVSIDTAYAPFPKFVALEADGHYFIGADNGLFTLLFDKKPDKVVELNLLQSTNYLHFPLRDIFVKAACHLARGGALEVIGKVIQELNHRTNLQPFAEAATIRGNVIYVDRFENVITNISRDLFEKTGKGRNFRISFRRGESLSKISKNYSDVEEGEKLCLFSISGFLEIAMNKGAASSLLGLKVGEMVRVEFLD